MYQPPYMQNEPYQHYQPYQQQQPQQQQTTYEYKPVTAQEVYPVETDVGQSEKRKRERPDYRPIPLRWPFISALILVLDKMPRASHRSPSRQPTPELKNLKPQNLSQSLFLQMAYLLQLEMSKEEL
ncbi:hypothetical protein LB503_005051 [Fusarium chuoi]|nr:hypothetical protein LB503_005051 [Fusarium chuoi]